MFWMHSNRIINLMLGKYFEIFKTTMGKEENMDKKYQVFFIIHIYRPC